MKTEKEILEHQKKWRDSHVPTRYKNLLERAHSSKSKATALKAKCIECVGFEEIAKRVKQCASYSCPLWGVRPFQKSNLSGQDANGEGFDEEMDLECSVGINQG